MGRATRSIWRPSAASIAAAGGSTGLPCDCSTAARSEWSKTASTATVLVQTKIDPLETAEKLSDTASPICAEADRRIVAGALSTKRRRMAVDARSFVVPDGRDPGLRRVPPPGSRPGHRALQGLAAAASRAWVTCPPANNSRTSCRNLERTSTSSGTVPGGDSGPFAHLRVTVKGTDHEIPVRWFYYLVSDPEGRQVTFSFRVEEKRLEAFGRADEQLVHSLRFVEKKLK